MGRSTQKYGNRPVADELSLLRHEMANVINGLAGMAELLGSSSLAPEQRHWLEAIGESAEQARFLLLGSSADAGHDAGVQDRGAPIDGVRALEKVVTAHTPAVLKTGRRLLLELEPGLSPYWRVNASLLRQVLDNLLLNAFKYAANSDVLVSAREAGEAVIIRVDDNGPGVARGQRERIFEPCQRGAADQAIPGDGIGLALCREIAGRMNGSLACADAPGGGARFEFTLRSAVVKPAGPTPVFTALNGMHCRLDLEPVLERIVGKMLQRLKVSYGPGTPQAAHEKVLEITISEERRLGCAAPASLVLQPTVAVDGVERVVVMPPLLESALQRNLLRQVLAWRWAINRPCATPG